MRVTTGLGRSGGGAARSPRTTASAGSLIGFACAVALQAGTSAQVASASASIRVARRLIEVVMAGLRGRGPGPGASGIGPRRGGAAGGGGGRGGARRGGGGGGAPCP